MAGVSLTDLTAGTRSTIGRYFSVVSMVPSVILVFYVFLLIRSGAWSHRPEWSAAINALVHIGIGGAAVLIVIGIVVGLGIHPIQFGLVQFLEGYWGTSWIAQRAQKLRISHHRKRAQLLDAKDIKGNEEASRLLAIYPETYDLFMPTRLGNVLRRYETLAGRQYELSALTILPHIALAARPEDVSYLDDQRTQLDLAVRMCFTAVFAAIASAAALWRDGLWLLVASIPACLAYISYRGAIISAQEYGAAINIVIDLNRFAFYERFHLPLPHNIIEERRVNKTVMGLLENNDQNLYVRYQHPSESSAPASPSG